MALVKYNNNSISAVSSLASLPSGALVPIKTLTASSSSTLSFVHGSSDVVLDSTYPIYVFKFINIHPATDSTEFGVGFRDGGTDYDATKTTTAFVAVHNEGDSEAALNNRSGNEGLAQNTGFQSLNLNMGNGNDESLSGEMFLFSPSSTTFVKHFMSTTQYYQDGNASLNYFVSGYCNVTAAIDAVQFKMNSGNIDAGKIKLYGIKDS
jgi:hypothetical protein